MRRSLWLAGLCASLACGLPPVREAEPGLTDTTTGAASTVAADGSGVADSTSSGAPPPTSSTSGEPGDDTSSSAGSSTTDATPTCDARPSWWDEAWSRRRRLDLDTTALAEPLADVPVLVRLDAERIDYAQTIGAGDDLRFLDAMQGTELPYEIEAWDPEGDSLIWVAVPTLASAGVSVWMYYGNPAAAAPGNGDAVWDDAFVSVHHGIDADATGNGHTASSAASPAVGDGIVASCGVYDGNDDYLELADEAAFDFTDALTVEAWIRVQDFDVGWQAIVTKGDDAWRLHREADTSFVGFGSDTPTTNDNLSGTSNVEDAQWHYAVIVYVDDEKRIFVDGELDVAQPYPGPLRTTGDPVFIGENAGAVGRFFYGAIDEVRISSVGRSEPWIELQNRSVRDTLIDFGAEETCP